MKAAKGYKLNDIVEVEWDDSATLNGWRSAGSLSKDADSLAKCKSIGYFFSVNSKSIKLSPNIGLETDALRLDTIAIPVGSVKRMRRLEKVR